MMCAWLRSPIAFGFCFGLRVSIHTILIHSYDTSHDICLASTSARLKRLLQLASQVIYTWSFSFRGKVSHYLLQLSPLLFRVEIVEIIRYIHSILQREVFHD